jgi:carboxymethylenebutenolidase
MDTTCDRISIELADGAADATFAHPVGDRRHPGVILYMDAYGLRPAFDAIVERIASHGFAVLAPNLFWRTAGVPVHPELAELMQAEDRAPLFAVLRSNMSELTPERSVSDSGTWLEWLAASEHVGDGPVGVAGYCMGGGHAMRAAAAYPERIAAVATYHAGNLANAEAADSPHLLAPRLAAEVYVAHADNDHSAPPEQQQRLEEALAAAGVTHHAEVYAGATHGFTQSDTPAFDADAAERHERTLLALLERTL